MAAVVGGVRLPLPAGPRVNGERYRGQGVDDHASGEARPQEEMEKGDVPLLGGADPGESAPALKWAMFGHGGSPRASEVGAERRTTGCPCEHAWHAGWYPIGRARFVAGSLRTG